MYSDAATSAAVIAAFFSLLRAGCHFKFWVADWFAQLNNKMGGDLKKIQVRTPQRTEDIRRTAPHQ